MGMQCTFSFRELAERHGCIVTEDDEVSTVTVALPNNQGSLFFGLINYNDPNVNHTAFCWFDCGRLDATRIAMFRFLIENRISFTCS